MKPAPEQEATPLVADVLHLGQQRRDRIYVADQLTVRYGAQIALRDVSLTLCRGKLTTIIGPSGCGKSSLLLCLGGLIDSIPESVVTGSLLFQGQPLYAGSDVPHALRGKIGYVFQQPTPFATSIEKNITLALRDQGIKNRDLLREAVESNLQKVGLWSEVKDRLKRSALTLSGGQQQRLCIARALALAPEVLLMDEPCSALDPLASGVVEELIKELSRGYTVVTVTHNLAQAKRIADDVAFFWVKDGAGCLVEHASAEETFAAPRDPLTQAYVKGVRG